MSKSRNNTIDVFLEDKPLRKRIMAIPTDSTPLEEPKDTTTCPVFALYTLLADEAQVQEMKVNYEKGGYGYGTAKQALYDLIITNFAEPREKYHYYMNNLSELDELLAVGAKKAQNKANEVLHRVRIKLGFK
jgi:tryptophanyl-tRNA synthetase